MQSTKVDLEVAISLIKEKRLIFVQDLADHLGISKMTMYTWWPVGGEDMEVIRARITLNKIELKTTMRNKWYKSQNPTLQISLYKMMANQEEREALSMNYLDVTSKGEAISNKIDLSKLSKAALEEIVRASEKKE